MIDAYYKKFVDSFLIRRRLEVLSYRRATLTSLTCAIAILLLMEAVRLEGTLSDFAIYAGLVNFSLNVVRMIYGLRPMRSKDEAQQYLNPRTFRILCHGINISWCLTAHAISVSNDLLSQASVLALLISCGMIAGAAFAFVTMIDLCIATVFTISLFNLYSCISLGQTYLDYVLGGLGIVFSIFMAVNAIQTFFLLIDHENKFQDKSEKNDLMRSLINAIPGFMTLVDRKSLRYVMANDALQKVIGSDIAGKLVGSHDNDDGFRYALKSFRDSAQQQLTREIQLGPLEDRQHYLISMSCLNDSLDLIAVVSINVEEQKKVELELAKTRNEAEHSSRLAALGEMVSSVAHEIRNPLTVIAAKAAQLPLMARKQVLTEEVLAMEGKRIIEMVERITKIIETVLKFGRGEEDQSMSKVRVSHLIAEVKALTEIRCKAAHVEAKFEKPDESLEISCYPLQLSQVLINLIHNAVDATEPLKERWIVISTQVKNDVIEIRVMDSGPGIPPEIKEKILQPFFTTKPPGKGTGLGLSISQNIVHKHRGRFWIDDQAPHTTFVVEIPLSQSTPDNRVA